MGREYLTQTNLHGIITFNLHIIIYLETSVVTAVLMTAQDEACISSYTRYLFL